MEFPEVFYSCVCLLGRPRSSVFTEEQSGNIR